MKKPIPHKFEPAIARNKPNECATCGNRRGAHQAICPHCSNPYDEIAGMCWRCGQVCNGLGA